MSTSISILVVASCPDVRKGLADILTKTNLFSARVVTAPRATHAIHYVSHDREGFDLVVATDAPKTHPCRLAAYMEKHKLLHDLVVIRTNEKWDGGPLPSACPVIHTDAPNLIDRVLSYACAAAA